jgi:signal transduction histidine kinase
MLLGSLRGLRVQILLWTVLPLTLVLVAVAVIGISTHQRSMQELVEELDARSARLAAAQLSDGLEERTALLEVLADGSGGLTTGEAIDMLFDGGLARYDARGSLVDAVPSLDAWRERPVSALLATAIGQSSQVTFSSLFVDPVSGRDSLLIAWVSDDAELVVGSVSLERLGLPEVVIHARAVVGESSGEPYFMPVPTGSGSSASGGAVAFLVDADGQIIYHPDRAQVGQDLREHEGVRAVIRGQAGATYHQEPDGQELVVGYAPVAGPGWGLIVQEPWKALIAPMMRLSLLAPLAVVAAALVSGLALTFGLRYVVRPLQTLDKQATRVAWGDFAAAGETVGGVQEIEDLRRTLEGMADQIQRYQSGMRDYIAAVTMAQEEERKRLARELHDETVQSLIALGHRVEMVQKALDKDPERARQRLAELQALAGEIQAEVRRFSRALRPLYLEDLGFVPALEMLAQETGRGNGLAVSLQVEGEVRRLAPDLELTAYRIVQEGLSNVVEQRRASRRSENSPADRRFCLRRADPASDGRRMRLRTARQPGPSGAHRALWIDGHPRTSAAPWRPNGGPLQSWPLYDARSLAATQRHKQNDGHSLAGRVKANVEPAPIWLSAQMRPPWAFTICREIASPNPDPPLVLARDLSPR